MCDILMHAKIRKLRDNFSKNDSEWVAKTQQPNKLYIYIATSRNTYPTSVSVPCHAAFFIYTIQSIYSASDYVFFALIE